MIGGLRTSAATTRLKSRALGSTALSALMVMATHAACAATPAPASGSLPGSFSANVGVTYAPVGTSTTSATIATLGGANVLQWGGTALANKITAPSGITANPGFSIGGGAKLAISGAATSVLVTDLTGSPSQIYGALNAGGLGGPLYVSNTNGVIVGSTGVITAPAAGVGLLGYAVDATAFGAAGTVTVNNATAGTGSVTVASGAGISGGPLLVASNGTVNIGAVSSASNYVLAGWGFSTAAGGVTPTPDAAALSAGASSVVNITPAASGATLTIDALDAGGAVNNSANLKLPTTLNVVGLFTNNGVLNDNGNLAANQLAGGLANNGVVNEAAAGLTIISNKGNIQSKGVLNLAAAGPLDLEGANVDLEGSVEVNKKALSTANSLTALTLSTLNGASPAQSGGVVDIGTSLFTNADATVSGNAIRVLSGGITDSGGFIDLLPGTDAAKVADPFYSLKSLNYTFSLFGGSLIQETAASGDVQVYNPQGSTSFSNSAGVNLNGQLSVTGSGTWPAEPQIFVLANNINSNNGLNGGFSVPNGGVINLQFFGNVNNPSGAAANGSSSFLYNYVPVTVAPSGGKAGTAEITLAGPSASSATEQNVNLLVQGNVNLTDGTGFFGATPLTAPTVPTAVQSAYANNHLVVTATGNIGLDPSLAAQPPQANSLSVFYWPGLVYLTSGATASNPTAAPNSTASIALGDTSGLFTGGIATSVNLSNIIAADLTTASVGGQTGGGGVHYLTNNLNLAPGTGTGTTTISNDSWANFLTPALAAAFQAAQGPQFFGGTISGSVVNVAPLPAADFQPK